MARGRKKQDKFAKLDSEWKDAVAASSVDDIRKRISDIALEREELLKQKEEDMQLKEALQAAKDAGEVYRDGEKTARLRIQFCKRVLEDRGAA